MKEHTRTRTPAQYKTTKLSRPRENASFSIMIH